MQVSKMHFYVIKKGIAVLVQLVMNHCVISVWRHGGEWHHTGTSRGSLTNQDGDLRRSRKEVLLEIKLIFKTVFKRIANVIGRRLDFVRKKRSQYRWESSVFNLRASCLAVWGAVAARNATSQATAEAKRISMNSGVRRGPLHSLWLCLAVCTFSLPFLLPSDS